MKVFIHIIGIIAFGLNVSAYPIKATERQITERVNIFQIQTFIDEACENEISTQNDLSLRQLTELQRLSNLIDPIELTNDEKKQIANVLPNCEFSSRTDKVPQKYKPCQPCLPFTFCTPCESNGKVVLTDAYTGPGDETPVKPSKPELEPEPKPGESQNPIKPSNPIENPKPEGPVKPSYPNQNPNQPETGSEPETPIYQPEPEWEQESVFTRPGQFFPQINPSIENPSGPKEEPTQTKPEEAQTPIVPASIVQPMEQSESSQSNVDSMVRPQPEEPEEEEINFIPFTPPESTNPGQQLDQPQKIQWVDLEEQIEDGSNTNQELNPLIVTSPGIGEDSNE